LQTHDNPWLDPIRNIVSKRVLAQTLLDILDTRLDAQKWCKAQF
jgi:hypothetical protein